MTIENRIKRLTIRARLSVWQGYGEIACQLFKHFQSSGIYCALRAISVDEAWGNVSSVPIQMKAQVVIPPQPEPWELFIASPDNVPTPGKKIVWFTMYESTEMPAQYITLLNRASLIVVPCEWNRVNFAANGVTAPIECVSLGFDSSVYAPSAVDANGPFVVGVAGRTRHCEKRKGIQDAIDLFLKTFPSDDSVRLHVKCHDDDKISATTDARIKIVRSHFEPYEIANWLRGLTVFLTLARGEGFGLWPLQALACGRPVIGCRYSGHADFMNDDNAIIIPHREVDAVSGESNVEYLGKWSEPNLAMAGKQLQVLSRSRSLATQKGLAAGESVKALTWANAAKNLIRVMEERGVIT